MSTIDSMTSVTNVDGQRAENNEGKKKEMISTVIDRENKNADQISNNHFISCFILC